MVGWEAIGAPLDWVVRAIAALGTPIIAYLVYKLNKNNSEFSRSDTKRANAIELNKIKLTLLDRRIDFIQKFEQVYNSYLLPESQLSHFASGLEDLRDVSRAIFQPPVQDYIDHLWSLAHKINQQARRAERLWEKEDPKAEAADIEMHASLDQFYMTKERLMAAMYDQTRIDIFDAPAT